MTTAVPRLRWIDVYHYEANNLRVHGRCSESSHEYRRYLQVRVRNRLRKGSSRVQLSEYLEELNSTGFAINEIARIAETDPCPAPWEIGEVLAEVLLEDLENAYFPWPPSWDKRTATASLPGPDLVGFIGERGDERFVFGEVKTSNAADVLQSVIYGDDGLRHQVSRLVSSKERREILISWLVARAQGIGALQTVSNVDISKLPEEEAEAVRTIPAMFYYGVSTVYGVLMRSLSVPRSIAVTLGERFKKEDQGGEEPRVYRARKWLENQPVEVWESVRPSQATLSGEDYKRLWRVLNGMEA